ncbi:UNVERIFIED_ORG: hypothetical protein ABIC97_000065 [Peribacillus simplex]
MFYKAVTEKVVEYMVNMEESDVLGFHDLPD